MIINHSCCVSTILLHPLQEAVAEEQRMAARYANDIEIAKAQRDFELKKAAYDKEVQGKKAESELAYDLQVHCRTCNGGEGNGLFLPVQHWEVLCDVALT